MTPMTLEDVHQVLYDILVDIHEFCVKNDIKYSLGGGSLLGAIRHNGFIPWDDDIDVQMSRPEYERFIHSYKSERGYQLFSRELPGCEDVGIAFARVCEMERTHIDTGLMPWQRCSTGLFVDILPIDGAPSDEMTARKKIKKMTFLWKISKLARARLPIPFSKAKYGKTKIKLLIKKIISRFIPSNFMVKYIRMCQEYPFETSEYLANYTTMQNGFREWQPRKSMDKFVLHQFEDGEFYIMEEYNTSLSHLYDNYMELPPVEKRIAHVANTYYWK